jgi:hypothetical protein
LSRLEKTRLVAEWDTALQNLRVCNKIPYGTLVEGSAFNCGKCEKCVRTMLALLALDVLKKTRAFGVTDVSAEAILAHKLEINGDVSDLYAELVPLLQEQGRRDLFPAIRKLVKTGRKAQKREEWKARVRDIDRKYIGGWLTTFRRLMQTGKYVPTQGL